MDYRDYKALMARYNEIVSASAVPEETEEGLISKLLDISYEKKQIMNETNKIIREYIVKYEKAPSLLDEEAVAALRDFVVLLMPSGESEDYVDPSISLRICRLLLGYYQSVRDLNQTVQMLCLCAMFDIMLMDHRHGNGSSPYTLMAEQYIKDFDQLSEQNKHRLINCWLLCVYNQEDRTFGLRKYRDIRKKFDEIRQKMGDDFETENYIQCKSYALGLAMSIWYPCNRDASSEALFKDLDENRDLIETLANELKETLASDQVCELLPDRMTTGYYIAQAECYLGKITVEELLARTEELTQPHEDYRAIEQGTALFVMNTCYLNNLRRCSVLDEQALLDKTLEIIAHVRRNMDDAINSMSQLAQYIGVDQGHRFILELMSVASSIVDFEFFKRIVLDMTVYTNKELYVHTMMVKEICFVLLDCILDGAPEYLDGVAGRSGRYWQEHRAEAMRLMENSALCHDIGKFFCLSFVNNASRSLTDDEFEYIKAHPTNFSVIYQGRMNPEIECIRDCAHLHHLWYDETAGYPREKHTANKPFVNILTIADCIDAATDYVGRPYGMGKTLDQVIAEFDAGKDTRYSGYVGDLLHLDEVRDKINHIIRQRRREIYCDIYLGERNAALPAE